MIASSVQEAARMAVIGSPVRFDPYGDYFREAHLRAEVERQIYMSLPVSNDPEQMSAVKRVIDSVDIGKMLQQSNGDVSAVVNAILQRCRAAADKANTDNSLMQEWLHGRRDGTGGPIRYKIIQRGGSLGMDDLGMGDHAQIQEEIEEMFKVRGETKEARYLADLRLWRIELSGSRFVYLSVDSIKYLAGQSLTPSFSGMVHAAPVIVGGQLQYSEEPIGANVSAGDLLVAGFAAALLAQMLASQAAKEKAEQEAEAQAARAATQKTGLCGRLVCEDVDMPENGFTPLSGMPHPSLIRTINGPAYPM